MKKNEKPGTVLFRTGDIARILNMSSSGVLFYDRKGVVSAARGENGYRGFDANALSTLGLLRAFERAGFTLEELQRPGTHAHCEVTEELLSLIDVLVDGRFEEEKKNISLRFRGSENQRLIDMKRTRAEGRVVLWQE